MNSNAGLLNGYIYLEQITHLLKVAREFTVHNCFIPRVGTRPYHFTQDRLTPHFVNKAAETGSVHVSTKLCHLFTSSRTYSSHNLVSETKPRMARYNLLVLQMESLPVFAPMHSCED